MLNINQINRGLAFELNGQLSNKKQVKDPSFTEMLKENIAKVNQLQIDSKQITQDFALGNIDSIHQVMLASEKAQLGLDLTISIQNKVLDSYQEIMRMQI